MAGAPVWYELMTPDPAAVAPFYRAVLGWDIQSGGGKTPTGNEYGMIGRVDGGFAGGVLTLSPHMAEQGGRPGWLPYFHADDVGTATEKAKSLGAKVWMPPAKIAPGTIAMLGDPQGAAFYLMDPVPPPGQPDAKSDVFQSGTPGHCWWNELETSDEPAATTFYASLFGWNTDKTMPMGEAGNYRFIEHDGEQIGAINPWLADYMTVGWLPYFGVADIDIAKAAAENSGGTIHQDVQEVPTGAFIIIATDPAGALVGFAGPKGAGT